MTRCCLDVQMACLVNEYVPRQVHASGGPRTDNRQWFPKYYTYCQHQYCLAVPTRYRHSVASAVYIMYNSRVVVDKNVVGRGEVALIARWVVWIEVKTECTSREPGGQALTLALVERQGWRLKPSAGHVAIFECYPTIYFINRHEIRFVIIMQTIIEFQFNQWRIIQSVDLSRERKPIEYIAIMWYKLSYLPTCRNWKAVDQYFSRRRRPCIAGVWSRPAASLKSARGTGNVPLVTYDTVRAKGRVHIHKWSPIRDVVKSLSQPITARGSGGAQ